MLKQFWKEFLLIAAVTAAGFLIVDFLGSLLVPAEKANEIFSSGTMIIGIAVMIVMFAIPFVAAFFGARKIISKGAEKNEAIWVPAFAALSGTLVIMLISVLQILFSTGAFLQEQMNQIAESGIDISNLTLAEFKTGMVLSVVIGIIFLSVMFFGIGAIAGLLAKSTFKNKK